MEMRLQRIATHDAQGLGVSTQTILKQASQL
jgi:hypothetical protein